MAFFKRLKGVYRFGDVRRVILPGVSPANREFGAGGCAGGLRAHRWGRRGGRRGSFLPSSCLSRASGSGWSRRGRFLWRRWGGGFCRWGSGRGCRRCRLFLAYPWFTGGIIAWKLLLFGGLGVGLRGRGGGAGGGRGGGGGGCGVGLRGGGGGGGVAL